MGDSKVKVQVCPEGPQICNVDPKLMRHFSIFAECDFCQETFSFKAGLEREMRKHYNQNHRLYCNACKKSDFTTREELDKHISDRHADETCFKCQSAFKYPSALAMHMEGPGNGCAVPEMDLINALRSYLPRQREYRDDPNAVYSPITCSPAGGETTVQKLNEFKKILLHAHWHAASTKKTFHRPEDNKQMIPVMTKGDCSNNGTISEGGLRVSKFMDKEMASDVTGDENPPHLQGEWYCRGCVDGGKFTSLAKLLQHVEGKAKNAWWRSVNSS